MTPSRLIPKKIILQQSGCESVITGLQPLSRLNQRTHTQLYYGQLQSNQHPPKAVVVKQLALNYTQINFANFQQELYTLSHCQSLAIEHTNNATSQASGLPTLYASTLSPHMRLFEANYLHQPLTPAMVMSYHPGQTLQALIYQNLRCLSLSFTQKMVIFLHICQVVNRLHQLGFMHLDIKPSNIIVNNHLQIVLIDFGLSQPLQQHHLTDSSQQQTAGTPAYMSPEQLTGQNLDHRSDYYSLGIVLFELVTGSLPFHANDAYGWAIAHCQTPVPYLTPTAQLSSFACQACQPFIDRLLAKHLDNRIDSLDKIINALIILLAQ